MFIPIKNQLAKLGGTLIGDISVTGVLAIGETFTELIEYLLTQDLIDGTGGDTGYKLVENTAGDTDGRCEDYLGAAWIPAEPAEYPKDGTIDLYEASGNHNVINTQTIFPNDEKMQITLVDDVQIGTAFYMANIRAFGDGTCNVYRGDEEDSLTLATEDTGLDFAFPVTAYHISHIPKIPAIPICVMSAIANITDTNAHEVTLTFNVVPHSFAIGDITWNATYVTVDNLVQDTVDPRIYTFDVTATGTDNASNTVTIDGDSGEYEDEFGNLSTEDEVSNTFSIVTAVDVFASFASSVNNDDETTTYSQSGNTCDLAVTVAGTNAYRPQQEANVASPVQTQDYEIQFDAVLNSGTCTMGNHQWRSDSEGQSGANQGASYSVTTGAHAIPTTDDVLNADYIRLNWDGTDTFDLDITNFKIVEV